VVLKNSDTTTIYLFFLGNSLFNNSRHVFVQPFWVAFPTENDEVGSSLKRAMVDARTRLLAWEMSRDWFRDLEKTMVFTMILPDF